METKKNTFLVSYFVQRGKPNSRGLVPIIGRITVNGEKVHFSTRLSIEPEKWLYDENGKSGGRTIGKSPTEKKINQNLDDLRSAIITKYTQMILAGHPVTAGKLKELIFQSGITKKEESTKQPKLETVMLLEFFESFNAKYLELVKLGKKAKRSWNRYDQLLRTVTRFLNENIGKDNIPLHEITTEFFEDFFLWLRKTLPDQDHNYHMKMVQRLATVHRRARRYGYVKDDPFANFEMSFEKKDRGYLTEDEVRTLLQKPMPSKQLDTIRDIFLFSCYTGLAYCDVKKLRKDEIVRYEDGTSWIRTQRGKTGNKCDIPLLDIPLQIIEKHRDSSDSEILMRVPSNQKINDYLKVIAVVCGIEKKFTFHLARHTFATTITLLNGVPIETVSKMLGHGSIKTTQIYARVIDAKIDRDMQALRASLGHQHILPTGVMQNLAT